MGQGGMACSVCSLLPCGGGLGRRVFASLQFSFERFVSASTESAATPLSVPSPQGGRERCGTSLRSKTAKHRLGAHFTGGFAANCEPRRHIRPRGSCHSFSVA